IPATETLITPVQCISVWHQFLRETEYSIIQATASQEQYKRTELERTERIKQEEQDRKERERLEQERKDLSDRLENERLEREQNERNQAPGAGEVALNILERVFLPYSIYRAFTTRRQAD
ncbi:hypothetical protein Tco_0896779, partial [Tanacetum coccineum]